MKFKVKWNISKDGWKASIGKYLVFEGNLPLDAFDMEKAEAYANKRASAIMDGPNNVYIGTGCYAYTSIGLVKKDLMKHLEWYAVVETAETGPVLRGTDADGEAVLTQGELNSELTAQTHTLMQLNAKQAEKVGAQAAEIEALRNQCGVLAEQLTEIFKRA